MTTRRARGFTLLELVVVVAIIVIVMGLITFNFPRSDRRLQDVKAAAEELAATCRQARALAIGRNAAHAVVFHIENAPDSNGRVLNNRSGGHWYRILGPAYSLGSSTSRANYYYDRIDNLPPIVGTAENIIQSAPYNLTQMAQITANGWTAEQHTLPAKRVRFLALTDMDYGDYSQDGYSYGRRIPSSTVSYPRPWFGWWDKTNAAGGGAGRLYPWGGYDPAIRGSGFYYWGSAAAGSIGQLEPQPINSTNAVTRALDRWVDGQQAFSDKAANPELPKYPGADILYTAGSPRPVINGTWRDMSIMFLPTGEACWGGTLPGRRTSYYQNNSIAGTPVFRGVAERCNGIFDKYGLVPEHLWSESGNFEQASGGFFITVGPDAPNDTDVFPSAEAARASLLPAYRVFVSFFGEIRVMPVSQSMHDLNGRKPFPTAENWYRSGNNMKNLFPQDRLLVSPGVPEAGGPITDFLTPDMLLNRSVWLK